ncbi:MAG: ester cyclase [Planctomycetota bacterium]
MRSTNPPRSAPFAVCFAAALVASCAVPSRDNPDARTVVSSFVEAANARDFGRVESLLLPDFTRHSQATPDVQVRSRADMLRFLMANAQAFADEHVELEETVVEGDLVAFRGTYTGRQIGQMGPFPPTGRTAKVDVSGRFRVEGTRIAELWIVWDNLTLLGQLGHDLGGARTPADGPEQRNEALARVWFDEVINRRNVDAIDGCYADNYLHHGPNGATIRGIAAAREFAGRILAASADRRATVERQVAAGNFVVTHFTSRGRMTGPFLGREPTGKEWVTEGIGISRIENGKIAEDWEVVSHTGL